MGIDDSVAGIQLRSTQGGVEACHASFQRAGAPTGVVHCQRSTLCRSHAWSDRGDPCRGGTLCGIGVNDLSHHAPGRPAESSRANSPSAGTPRATDARGNGHSPSAGLGYHPGAGPCHGSVLLPLYGGQFVSSAHPSSRCTRTNAGSWRSSSLI